MRARQEIRPQPVGRDCQHVHASTARPAAEPARQCTTTVDRERQEEEGSVAAKTGCPEHSLLETVAGPRRLKSKERLPRIEHLQENYYTNVDLKYDFRDFKGVNMALTQHCLSAVFSIWL